MTDAAERVEQIERQVDAARRMVRATLRQFIEGPGNRVTDDDPSPEALTVSLVLLHSKTSGDANTDRWLWRRKVAAHHHIRAQLDRLLGRS
jgi:hypothetical protein